MTSRTTQQLERKLGRYLTLTEIEEVDPKRTSRHVGRGDLTEEELRAVKRIWPRMQLEFKLEGGRPDVRS